MLELVLAVHSYYVIAYPDRVILYYGRLVSLRLSINKRTANFLNNFSLKCMLNH